MEGYSVDDSFASKLFDLEEEKEKSPETADTSISAPESEPEVFLKNEEENIESIIEKEPSSENDEEQSNKISIMEYCNIDSLMCALLVVLLGVVYYYFK